MTVRKYSSRAQQTTLSAPITSTASTMSVVNGASVMGGKTLTSGQTYTVVIDPDTALEEIVDVTVYSSGNTLNIARGVDGPNPGTGVAHSAGAIVRHMAIGRDYQDANDHQEQTTGTAHGLVLGNITLSSGTGNVSNTMLATDSVTTVKIANANVTTAKIADSAITSAKIADLTVATGDIADLAITTGKLADAAVTTGKITDGAVTEAKIVTSGVTTTKIADSAVTSAKIADGTIVAGDIADGAITTAKIAAGAVETADLADSAVTSAKIADGTIVAGDLADGAVTSAKILDGTIVNADINAAAAIAYSKLALTGAITSADIANDTIVNADINSTAGIAYSKLSLGGTITSADLVDGTIVNSDINASAGIALSKLATDPLARANHTGTQTASTVSDFDTQVRTSKVTDLAAPTTAFSMNSQKITTLATPTDAGDASTKGYVDAQITALVGGAPGTLDTLAEIASAISSGGSFESTVVLKSGSTMTGALVLNANPSTALGAATKQYVDTVAGSATAAAASAADAATTYDNFDDRYLGAKATPPTLDNDGNAIIEGALYWNSVDNAMYAWDGAAWGSISSTAAIFRFRFTATAGQTSISGVDDNGLTLSYLVGKEQVYLNGVLLARTSDYSASSGTSITSLAALAINDVVEIITFTAFDLTSAIPNTSFTAKGTILVGTDAGTYAAQAVGANGKVLMADSAEADGVKWYDAVAPATVATVLQTNTAFGQVPAQVVLQASINNFQIGSMGSFTSGDLAIFNNAFPVGSVVTVTGNSNTATFTVTSAGTIGGGNINVPITTFDSGFIFFSPTATLTSGVSTTGKFLTNDGTTTSWASVDLTAIDNNYILALMGAI